MIKKLLKKTIERRFLAKKIIAGIFAFALISSAFPASMTEAAVNQQINYQGKLTNSSSVNVPDGTYNIKFRLYVDSSTTTALWTELRESGNKVQVTSGLFSVMLGEVTDFTGVDFNQTLYLGVTIGGTGAPSYDPEMAPRKKLGVVPAAIQAVFLGSASSTQYLRNDQPGILSTTTSSTLLTLNQTGAGNLFGVKKAGTEMFTIFNNGNIGVGTTSPAAKFDIYGTSSLPTIDLFAVSSSSNARFFTITANGSVGVGSSTPGSLFSVGGDISLTGALRASGNAGTIGMLLQTTGSGVQWVGTSTLGITGAAGPSSFTIGNGFIYNATSTDLVGIGSTTPIATLSIKGKAGTNPFVIASSTNAQLFVVNQAGNVGIGTSTPISTFALTGTGGINPFVVASSSGAQLLTILQNGYVGIGSSSPAWLLTVTGTTSVASLLINNYPIFANSSSTSLYLGLNAGLSATNTADSFFVGSSSGSGATNAFSSVFIGPYAGFGALTSNSSVFIGPNAGYNATNSPSSNFIGVGAGYLASDASGSNFFGPSAGQSAVNADNSNFIGYTAGQFATNAASSNFLGFESGVSATNASSSNFLGYFAGYLATNAANSTFIGVNAGFGATNAANSIFIGRNAGYIEAVVNNIGTKSSILIGNYTSTGGFSNSIAIGQGTANNAVDQLNIGGVIYARGISSSTTASAVPTSGGLVGIGTSSPSAKLDVYGNSGSGDIFALSSSSFSRLFTVTSAGNVGIGTSTPLAKLDVFGASTSPSSDIFAVSSSSLARYLTVTAAGNVGIGTSTPAEKLHVAGNIMIDARTDNPPTWTKRSFDAAGTITSGGTASIASTTAMAVFNGSLYAGTTNANAAEIYRYNSGTGWTKVSSTTAGVIATGGTANIDGIASMMVWNGQLYAGTSETGAAQVYRYDGGTTWTRVSSSTAGAIGGNGTTTSIDAISAMAVNGGYLYVGTAKANAAEVYRYNELPTAAHSWTKVSNIPSNAGTFGVTALVDRVSAMASFQGDLYVGTTEGVVSGLYRYDGQGTAGTGFTLINTAAGTFSGNGPAGAATITGIGSIRTMAVYNGKLYLGIDPNTTSNAAQVIKWDGSSATGTNFELISSSTTGVIAEDIGANTGIDFIGAMAVYHDDLYLGTVENAGTAEVYKLDEGNLWTKVSSSTAGVIASSTASIGGVYSMETYNDDLWVGTGKTAATEVYSLNLIEGVSYRLQFAAASDDANGEQNGLRNLGNIEFQAEETAHSNAGNINTGKFVFSHGINTVTGAYDLAEDYPTNDDTLGPADLVSLNATERGLVRKSNGKYDKDIIGVYSENPAMRLSQKGENIDGSRAIPVALVGRVPVKASLENGPIKIGDYLTASAEPGKAAKATRAGRVIGRALSAYDGSEGEEARVTVFLGVETITWGDLADASSTAAELGDGELPETVDSMTQLVEDIRTSTSDIALTVISKMDNLTLVISNKITAIIISAKQIFVDTLAVLPGGNIFLPSGENQIAGIGLLASGTTEIFVPNTQIDANSSVYLTPTSATDVPLFVAEKRAGRGFLVRVAKSISTDITFDWFFIKTYSSRNNSDDQVSTIVSSVTSTSTDAGSSTTTTSTVLTSTTVSVDENNVSSEASTTGEDSTASASSPEDIQINSAPIDPLTTPADPAPLESSADEAAPPAAEGN